MNTDKEKLIFYRRDTKSAEVAEPLLLSALFVSLRLISAWFLWMRPAMLFQILLFTSLNTLAQVGEVYKGFKLLDYYKPANSLRSQITGGEAQSQPNGIVRITKGVRIEN